MKVRIFSAVLFGIIMALWPLDSAEAESSKYLVLFKQAEVAVSSLDHSGFQNLLQSSNKKNVDQLNAWLSSTPLRGEVSQDLWMIRGASLRLSDADAARLAREPWVQAVHPDRNRRWLPTAGPRAIYQNLADAPAAEAEVWGLKSIGVAKLKAEFPKLDGSGVRVGVLDSGIQSNHAEIKGRLSAFRDFVNRLPSAYDDQGHGTHVCGTIAGREVGVAPGASLIVAKVFSASGTADDSEILAAMQWMFDPDGDPSTNDFPSVVSNSWGGDLTGSGVLNVNDFAPYWLAIQAWIHGGITPVFAAGNSGDSPNGFPGGLPEPIAVGAYGSDGKIADFSSRGPNLWRVGESVLTLLKPDISAPGVKITSSIAGNKYASWDGTSMATPHVSGAIAILKQVNPKLKFAEIKELLLRSSQKKLDVQFGFGTLDLYELVKLAQARYQ